MLKKKKLVIVVLCFLFSGFILMVSILGTLGIALLGEKNEQSAGHSDVSMDGLPPFITQEMLIAALEEQDASGYPASVTIAQIIAESGFGRYGPGGEQKQGLSKLAYNYKNLFGMKAPAGDSTPIGTINMQTGEEVNGNNITIKAGFLIFATYSDCIKYRSGLIGRVYFDLVNGVTEPDEFAKKLGKRWATNSNYGNTLIRLMQQYNLYRFNSITANDFLKNSSITSDGMVSSGQRKISDIALSLNNQGCARGLCQQWVARVYQQAGQNPYQSRACATEAANAFLVSGSKVNIPIGATVYGTHSYGNVRCGNHDAGHVGIYVGNGKIVSNEGRITVKSMEQWIATYGWRGWGWNGNEDFSKR